MASSASRRRFNEFLAPHNGGDEKVVTSGKVTLTNSLTGDTAIQRFAGPVGNTFVSGDPDGVHVERSTVKGLPEMWKLEHGRRLIRDAGYVVIQTTFDGEELVSQEVLVAKGRTPTSKATSICSARPSCRRSGSQTDLQEIGGIRSGPRQRYDQRPIRLMPPCQGSVGG